KMRSLVEKLTGAPQNKHIGKGVHIHVAETEDEYHQFWVNPVFGVPGEVKYDITGPTRLVVRDVQLDPDSLKGATLDLPFTEVKWENALDRVTSAATPRQIERVPAGAVFKPMQLVFSLYQESDCALLPNIFTALQLVEDDYLGGQGSRGSGKVAFNNITLTARVGSDYRLGEKKELGNLSDLSDAAKQDLEDWARGQFFANGAS
ncbi:MAG: type III-A CRISPR-associated RAMP protein Csm3, partial [Chloroflexi bacterium]